MRYKQQEYISHYFCSPHDADNNVYEDNIPENLNVNGIEVRIFDGTDFLPETSNQIKSWKKCPRSGFYTHVETGLKVKLRKIVDSKLHHQDLDMGTDTFTILEIRSLKVKIPVGKPINENSLKNLNPKQKREAAVRVNVRLDPKTIELAKKLGNGKIGDGLDKMASQML